MDKAKGVRQNFFNEVNKLKSAEDFRQFVLKYFSSHETRKRWFNIILGLNMVGQTINDDPMTREYFVHCAFVEFSKKQETQFTIEEIKLGFMG